MATCLSPQNLDVLFMPSPYERISLLIGRLWVPTGAVSAARTRTSVNNPESAAIAAAASSTIVKPAAKLWRTIGSIAPCPPGSIRETTFAMSPATIRETRTRMLDGSRNVMDVVADARCRAVSLVSTAPRPAMPVTRPTKRVVPLIPDAMPPRSGGTTLICTLAVSPFNSPAPQPVSAMPIATTG